jgi:hypothetical protein
MEIPFDRYTYRARVLPVLIVCAPLAFAVATWFPDDWDRWRPVLAVLMTFGITAILPHLARDLGREKEPQLFRNWHGPPTRRLLSHQASRLDANTLARRHARLGVLISGIKIPSAHDEATNPVSAAQIYDSCVLYLRENTRDAEEFPLVLAENINYGFRRNLWASKSIGLPIAAMGTAACVVSIAMKFSGDRHGLLFGSVAALLCVGLLAVWIRTINESWVRRAAKEYADRLIGTLDKL